MQKKKNEIKINKKIDYKTLLDNAESNIKWNDILLMRDLNKTTDNLINMITKCISESVQIRKHKKNNKELIPKNKLITSAILISFQKRELLYNLQKKKPNSEILKITIKIIQKLWIK